MSGESAFGRLLFDKKEMRSMLIKLYCRDDEARDREKCYYIGLYRKITPDELQLLKWLVRDTFTKVRESTNITNDRVVEIGPRLSMETPFSSNAVAICASMGLPVERIEASTRFAVTDENHAEAIIEKYLDRMTQEVYVSDIVSFESERTPDAVYFVPVMEEGARALRRENEALGLGMDDGDIAYYTKLFTRLGRNPTDVECFHLGNANSEHSRHWFFRGIQIIDGKEMPLSLMDLVREPLNQNRGNSLVAFRDNAGVIQGTEVLMFAPASPGTASTFGTRLEIQHITATAETHNHPTLIAPFPGAETGSGGRIRDNRAVGRGALTHAGLAGYCVGNLHLPGYKTPGETLVSKESGRYASPLKILIEGSNGISDYGNKIGEPLIGGFCRSFGQMVGGTRREFRKPVLYSAGFGRVNHLHTEKHPPEKGMLIVRIGGGAYRIGVGGGSASSMAHGTSNEELDLQSVQRGNAEMENRVNRVIQACAEMHDDNPIESIHDQGAGGLSNVLTELLEPAGGRIDIRKVTRGDKTMSILEIWVAEYQESYGLLVKPENLKVFQTMCERERVNCDVVGDITGDGKVVVCDSKDNTTPVNLPLTDILSDMPRKKFSSHSTPAAREPLELPKDLSVEKALRMIFKLPEVGSKGFLVRKVDRSVTGLVALQQCVGPTGVPVADAAVTADGYFGKTGAAAALGENPLKMLVSPESGAQMALAEMLTNLACVKVSRIGDITCRANWMWAAKLPGEGALIYRAALALRDMIIQIGACDGTCAIDGGKDSISMAVALGDEIAVSPGELVVMGYAPVPDITKIVTPDFEGNGFIGLIDIGCGKNRLGGSSLAHVLGQLGDTAPGIEDPLLLRNAFKATQKLIEKNLITAYHDRSDGGLVTTVAEMCFASNLGARLWIHADREPIPFLFNEEAGMVFEYNPENERDICSLLKEFSVRFTRIGTTTDTRKNLVVETGAKIIFEKSVAELRRWWEETSTRLEYEQANRETVLAEERNYRESGAPKYSVPFTPKATAPAILRETQKPQVAILREEGTNGDREMAAAFYRAGFTPWDITMSDIMEGRVTNFDAFRGLVFPGGFSYADVFGSAKGWAGSIQFNPRVQEIFNDFYRREDTFSLGVCNGCQLLVNTRRILWQEFPKHGEPQLVRNTSGRFESRWVGVKILPSPSLFFKGMEGSVLGIWVAHAEGRFLSPNKDVEEEIERRNLVPLVYADPNGAATEKYPYNPNGSPRGCAALCSPDGRHLAMMPHPERSFISWQWPWMPKEFKNLKASPWLTMFQNAREWCQSA